LRKDEFDIIPPAPLSFKKEQIYFAASIFKGENLNDSL
jgi:hypothetical protein